MLDFGFVCELCPCGLNRLSHEFTYTLTYYHYYCMHLTAFFHRTTWVSQYQKGKTSLDFIGKRWWGLEMTVASAGPYANNMHLAPDRQPHQHLITQFLQAGCSSWRPANIVRTLKTNNNYNNVYGAVIMSKVIARVHPVHLMNVDWAPGGRQPSDQACRLGLWVRRKLAYYPHPPSPLLLLLSP